MEKYHLAPIKPACYSKMMWFCRTSAGFVSLLLDRQTLFFQVKFDTKDDKLVEETLILYGIKVPCCFCIRTQSACNAVSHAHLLHLGFSWVGVFKTTLHSVKETYGMVESSMGLQYTVHVRLFPCFWEILPIEDDFKHLCEEHHCSVR